MKLIIAEKPQLGRAIADALPGKAQSKDGVIIKGDCTIIWASGHLLTLKEPEDFDERYKTWTLEDLPFFFEPWGNKIGKTEKKKPGQPTKAQRVKQIGEYLKKADLVIHAGDNDEEGQLLIDELLRWFHYKGRVLRLDTGDTSAPALRKALNRMKDNTLYEANGWSAYGRTLSDAVFGFNLTRYFSLKNNSRLPVGRVQTPTLGLVVQRDALIENHVKSFYYELFADLKLPDATINAKFIPHPKNPDLSDGKFLDKAYLSEREVSLRGQTFPVATVKKDIVHEAPPLPFNLTKLTSYCSKKWGYTPADVMQITQQLRDNHKAITYNRSDCQYLTEEHFKEAPATISAAAGNLGLDASMFHTSIKSKCFNDENVSVHFAIIPTSEKVNIDSLSTREKNVYMAICHYYLAQFLPPAQKEKTVLELFLGKGELFRAVSSVYVDDGFLQFLKTEGEREGEQESEEEKGVSSLSDLEEGEYSCLISDTEIKQKETHPPARYTQASLAEDMTRIAKYITDPEIKKLLLEKDKDRTGENGSIGTTATRPDIISGLISSGYLTETKTGKRTVLVSTPKGREFYNMLPDDIKRADVTAKWWSIQEDIKTGAATPESMARDVLATVKDVIHSGNGTLDNASRFVHGSTGLVVGACPVCGGEVIENAAAFSCSQSGCKCVFFKNNNLMASIGKKMTSSVVKMLLAKGQASLKGCTSEKSGNKFDCTLKVEYGNNYPKLSIDFSSKLENEGVTCPKCGGNISKNKFGNYACGNWRQGCKFTIFGEISGKKLTENNVRDLIKKGRTPELHGFKGKRGNTFDARLVLERDGKVSFQFVDHPKKW